MPDCEFSDEAVSGTMLRRKGLDGLLEAAAAGRFDVLYFHSLSRLARESIISMPTLKRLVYTFKVRVISVTEGIDSARDGWDVIASVMSLLHERYVKELSQNVFRGQEGAVLAGYSVGDHRLGYKSVPVPGMDGDRRGRGAQPRMMYEIDEETAPWVIRIFYWFVRERRSLRWITRELNRLGAPKCHRATTKHWHHTQVTDLLACEKYVGRWAWGERKNVRDPETGKIRQEMRPEEECEKWVRDLPDLRIIDDETFAAAQQILEENCQRLAAHRRKKGRLAGSARGGNSGSPPHLLYRLVQCGECGSTFSVGGTFGKYLICPGYTKGICTCQTKLRRDLAEQLILDAVGARILSNPTWFQAVYAEMLRAAGERDNTLPLERSSAERAVEELDRKIGRLIDQIENEIADPAVSQRLADRREERRELVRRRDELRRTQEHPPQEPTEDWLRACLKQLGETLHGGTPAAAVALRQLLSGAIVVTEIRREGRKRFYLQGRFEIRSGSLANLISATSLDDCKASETSSDPHLEEIVIDFVRTNPLDASAERAKELYDRGLLEIEIAKQLSCSKTQITKLLHHWFESRGLPVPDGRVRRSTLARMHQEPPQYQQLAEPAIRLWDKGLLIDKIAQELKCTRVTTRKAIKFWYQSHGQEMPDGRNRRKTLNLKAAQPVPPAKRVSPTDSSAPASA